MEFTAPWTIFGISSLGTLILALALGIASKRDNPVLIAALALLLLAASGGALFGLLNGLAIHPL
jgi:hypothetical protein